MSPADRRARILRWLRRQDRWISSTDLHRWMRANLGTRPAQRRHDLAALRASGQLRRRPAERWFDYRGPANLATLHREVVERCPMRRPLVPRALEDARPAARAA